MTSKSSFFAEEELDLRWVDGHDWIVTKPFTYPSGEYTVVVPFGFRTDFASIPRVLWNILPPTGTYGKAAVLHDFMYQTGKWMIDGVPCTRSSADSVLRAGMDDCGVGGLTRWMIYTGVRVGGWVRWNECRLRDVAEPDRKATATQAAA